MATGSKGGRTYSDPSYGSVKTMQFAFIGTAGTRATGTIIDTIKPMNPITVLDWQMTNTVLASCGSSQWVLAATSSLGTAALGTIVWAGTHDIGVTIEGTATETDVAKAGSINLMTVLSTSNTLAFNTRISYREKFDVSDN